MLHAGLKNNVSCNNGTRSIKMTLYNIFISNEYLLGVKAARFPAENHHRHCRFDNEKFHSVKVNLYLNESLHIRALKSLKVQVRWTIFSTLSCGDSLQLKDDVLWWVFFAAWMCNAWVERRRLSFVTIILLQKLFLFFYMSFHLQNVPSFWIFNILNLKRLRIFLSFFFSFLFFSVKYISQCR